MSENYNLTAEELDAIRLYTIQKINNYPKRLGKTVENYFDVLYKSEINGYISRRDICSAGAENDVERKAAV